MAGHSKWANIQHRKGRQDAKRGKIFTRLIKEITVAARMGGGDPNFNPRLRLAIEKAKTENMPSDNIKRAIRRGTGEEPGVSYEEAQYEAYGPGGAALIIETLTDNKNRTVGELRHLLTKYSGNLAETNAVAWMFAKRGYIVVPKSKASEDTLMAAVIAATCHGSCGLRIRATIQPVSIAPSGNTHRPPRHRNSGASTSMAAPIAPSTGGATNRHPSCGAAIAVRITRTIVKSPLGVRK